MSPASPLSLAIAPISARGAQMMIGKYAVLRELGRGATACVYEAEHRQLAKRVAVKVLHPHLRTNRVATERFSREGRVTARLKHPNIVAISDSELEVEVPHLVMDLVSGPSLAGLLLAEGKVRVAFAIDLLLPVLSAVAHAHAAGVVHRDLKPGNILLEPTKGALRPMVTDFGIGKVLDCAGDAPLTLDGGLVGSIPYLAPEQVRDARAVDGTADQYAIGVILYEMITGCLPFPGTSVCEMLRAIGEGEQLGAHDVDPELPRALSDVIARAMRLRSDARYPSIGALAAELLPFASPSGWSRWAREFTEESAAIGSQTMVDSPPPLEETAWSASSIGGGRRRGFATSTGTAIVIAVLAAGFGVIGGRWTMARTSPAVVGTQLASSLNVPADAVPLAETDAPPLPSSVAPLVDLPSPSGARAGGRSGKRAKPRVDNGASVHSENDVYEYGENRAPILH